MSDNVDQPKYLMKKKKTGHLYRKVANCGNLTGDDVVKTLHHKRLAELRDA